MDVLFAWKILSALSAGCFGVLALLKDYKDKATGKITIWGRVSLAGILISTLLGILAQLKESSEAEKAKARIAAQTLELAQNTSVAVRNTAVAVSELRRALSPFEDPRFSVQARLPCNSDKYRQLCLEYKATKITDRVAKIQALSKLNGAFGKLIYFEVEIFVDSSDAGKFLEGRIPHGDFYAFAHAIDPNQGDHYSNGPDEDVVFFDNRRVEPGTAINNGRILSILDVYGATVLVTEFGGYGEPGWTVESLSIATGRGRRISNSKPAQRVSKGDLIFSKFIMEARNE
jgi:hypothetical protein